MTTDLECDWHPDGPEKRVTVQTGQGEAQKEVVGKLERCSEKLARQFSARLPVLRKETKNHDRDAYNSRSR